MNSDANDLNIVHAVDANPTVTNYATKLGPWRLEDFLIGPQLLIMKWHRDGATDPTSSRCGRCQHSLTCVAASCALMQSISAGLLTGIQAQWASIGTPRYG